MVVEVLINRFSKELNQAFDYLVPQSLEDSIDIGLRVFVPLGFSKEIGYVTKIKDKSEFNNLKSIIEVIDLEPLVSKKDIDLAKLISIRYFTSFSASLELMIPLSLRKTINKELILLDRSRLDERLIPYFNTDKIIYSTDLKKYQNLITTQIKNKVIELNYIVESRETNKLKPYVRYLNDYNGRSNQALELSNYLKNHNDSSKEDILNLGYSKSQLDTLVKNNCVRIYYLEEYRSVSINLVEDTNFDMNLEQRIAYNNVLDSFNTNTKFLLHGVCGSGKTLVYLNLIEEILKIGKQALVLIPEISLTTQVASIFKSRFKNNLALIHSKLSAGERYDEYKRIKKGEANVVVGVRSAIFAPLNNLGLIIIDECQSDSYIQTSTPCYNAIFIAEYLSNYFNCPLLLGSATPLVETYYKALNGEYKLLKLTKRANNKLQEKSIIVDMREELKNKNRSIFSCVLQNGLKETYSKKEQSILFINRRGFATSYSCRSCGNVVKCPNCNLPLTYHKVQDKLKCHYCNYEIIAPKTCPNCNSTWIKALGSGTEKVEEEIKKLIPQARVLRLDLDTTSKKDSYNNYLKKINNHEYDIILGTQIVAKGLDFPLVSLVGIINADLSLNMPSYKAYEDTYDLIEQVSGRAGRKDTNGLCIIQTYNPTSSPIVQASRHAYLEFYKTEIRNRELLNNPPFANIVEMLFTSSDSKICFSEALKVKNILSKNKSFYILGPVVDKIYMMNNEYRVVLTIKSKIDDFSDINEIIDNYLSFKNLKIYAFRM